MSKLDIFVFYIKKRKKLAAAFTFVFLETINQRSRRKKGIFTTKKR